MFLTFSKICFFKNLFYLNFIKGFKFFIVICGSITMFSKNVTINPIEKEPAFKTYCGFVYLVCIYMCYEICHNTIIIYLKLGLFFTPFILTNRTFFFKKNNLQLFKVVAWFLIYHRALFLLWISECQKH